MIRASRSRLVSSVSWVVAVFAAPLLISCGPGNGLDGETQTDRSSGWEPDYITVKYRGDPVDIAAPYFEELSRGFSSLVDNAWYDSSNEYMVIVLNGVAYHYCGMDEAVWNELNRADSRGSFYRSEIRGNFDCRLAPIPSYP